MGIKRGFNQISAYVRRSAEYASRESVRQWKGDAGDWQKEKTLFEFKNRESIDDWIVGTDGELGGSSTLALAWKDGNLLLEGNLSMDPSPTQKDKQMGYVACRSKTRPFTLAHTPTFDVTLFRYLAIRARGDGKQWFVNLQGTTHVQQDLWQHRMVFERPGEWETILIPFRDFLLTNHGWVQARQIPLDTASIRTIGFSLVRQPGPYSLEIESIKAENTRRTCGDLDLLEDGEFVDQEGNVKRTNETAASEATDAERPIQEGKFEVRRLTKKQREDAEWLKEYYSKPK